MGLEWSLPTVPQLLSENMSPTAIVHQIKNVSDFLLVETLKRVFVLSSWQ